MISIRKERIKSKVNEMLKNYNDYTNIILTGLKIYRSRSLTYDFRKPLGPAKTLNFLESKAKVNDFIVTLITIDYFVNRIRQYIRNYTLILTLLLIRFNNT